MEHVDLTLIWSNRSRFRFGVYYDEGGRGEVLGLAVIGVSPSRILASSFMTMTYGHLIVPKRFLGRPNTKALRYIVREREGWNT